MSLLEQIYTLIFSPALLIVILCAGIYITARLGIYFLRHPIRVWKDIFFPAQGKNRCSAWKALTVALAGTLGVGNISGVATAIAIGGAGAIFWMWIGALLSMLIKYSEVVLAVRYRKPVAHGYIGGAMYYFRKPICGIIFALLCLLASFSLGNLLQAQTVTHTMERAFGISPLLSGSFLAVLLYLAICRGFSRISSVTFLLIPMMSGIYVLLCGIILASNWSDLPSVCIKIFTSALSPGAVIGGTGGLALAQVIRAGISRGLITHEAGCGTAPIAHAEADTDNPVRQGFLGIFEVFADTILLCSLTAFAVLSELPGETISPSADGMDIVIAAFGPTFGNLTTPILAVLIFSFGLATMIGWSYYGKRCLDYLLQPLPSLQKYKKLYGIAYSFLTLLGGIFASNYVWLLADYSVACMTLLHIPTLLQRSKEVALLTRTYFKVSQLTAREAENIPLHRKQQLRGQRRSWKHRER